MKILGIDIETGGNFADPIEKNFITEIGAVLWDTETGTPVKMYSAIIFDHNKESSEEAIDYTGITNEMRVKFGITIGKAILELSMLMKEADYVMAHNGENFDKPIIMQEMSKQYSQLPKHVENMVWIDSLIDCEYPAKYTNHNLTYLKGAEGIMYPGHRAIFDVCAMLELNLTIRSVDDVIGEINKKKYLDIMDDCLNHNLNEMITSATSPMVEVRAIITFHDLKGREEAKKNKFRWNPESKMWTKQLRKSKLAKVDWSFKWSLLDAK